MKIPSRLYIAPEAEEITISSTSPILSDSKPKAGGNEGITYENW